MHFPGRFFGYQGCDVLPCLQKSFWKWEGDCRDTHGPDFKELLKFHDHYPLSGKELENRGAVIQICHPCHGFV